MGISASGAASPGGARPDWDGDALVEEWRRTRYGRIRGIISVLALIIMVAAALTGSERSRPEKKEEEKQPVYGEYLDWAEVNKAFPKYARADVIDFETGLRFSVQRRAGSGHADVQPLTAGDTGVMKKVYVGSWSWKRRAVLVVVGDRRIAGSMNGMPHGGGLISGNDFPGHFCIHFRGSTLHVNGREDLAHRIMVCKAAGVLEDMMAKSPAEEVARIFFTALDQREMNVCVRAARFDGPAELLDLYIRASRISGAGIYGASPSGGGAVDVSVGIAFKNGRQKNVRKKTVTLVHTRGAGWRVDYSSVRPLLAPDGGDTGGKPGDGGKDPGDGDM